jgi:hypothetical protein
MSAAAVTRRCHADADGADADLAVEIGWLMVDPPARSAVIRSFNSVAA